MNDETENLSSGEMAEFVDDDLMSKIGNLINGEHKTVTTVEMSLTAMLGTSIADSCESLEEIQTQIQAYVMFLTNVAIGTFLEDHPQSKPN